VAVPDVSAGWEGLAVGALDCSDPVNIVTQSLASKFSSTFLEVVTDDGLGA
jgi:hypothetical protein